MAKKRTYTAKSPVRRAKAAVVGVVLHMLGVGAFAIMVALNLSHLVKAEGGTPLTQAFSLPGFEAYTDAYGLAALAQLASLFVYGVLFLMWIHRTNRNAQTLSSGMEVSPGWAVGWFFVPFASLYKPFQGLDQTWRVSTEPARWKALDTPVILRVWWGLYLGGNIGNSLSSLVSREHTVQGHVAAAILALLSAALILANSVAAIRIVRTLTARQVSALEVDAFA